MKKLKTILASMTLFLPGLAKAASSGTTDPDAVAVPVFTPIMITTGLDSPVEIAYTVISWLLIASGVIALGFMVYGGILFVTSGGDAEKTTKARNTLLYSVIGVIVIVLGYAILYWAANTLVKNVT